MRAVLLVTLAMLAVLAVLAGAATVPSAVTARPGYIDCVDSSECGPFECCVLGGGRYSLPRCAPVSNVGDPCRPGVSHGALHPINTTVSYPDGAVVHLPAVYLHMCPCAAGLTCPRPDAVCAAPDEHELNYL